MSFDAFSSRAMENKILRDSSAAQLRSTDAVLGGPLNDLLSSLAALKTAVNDEVPRIVVVQGTITGNEIVRIKSNKSVIGAPGAALVGVGLKVSGYNNIIVRNLKISFVLAGAGDAVGAQEASNLWFDHLELSSDLAHDIDYYDGLLDLTHGTKYVTISWCILRDHWKTSLIGHNDNNESEDVSITATYHHNYFKNIDARGPSVRFGKAHIYNNFYENVKSAVNTRMGAQVLVENNVFKNVTKPILAELSDEVGYAVERGNVYTSGSGSNTAPLGTLTSVPYSYALVSATAAQTAVVASAGAKLTF
ncbi:hypothetical protein FRC03_003791 [Tulasnella sp. 419]|nr:hypothetical protein FRC03_003791 [Tulasnella sp. 419]